MPATRKLDKVIAITGASSGIGRAVAERAASEGAAVVLSARRVELLNEVVAAIVAKGGRALAVPGDVTSEADMHTLVARTVEAFGRIDVMLCNAGIGYHDRFDTTSPNVMRRLMDVNVLGSLYAAHAALPRFRSQNSGHIIAVSSIVGRRGIPGSTVYSASKAAQIGFIEGLRGELYGTGIHASIVYPVSTQTEFRAAIQRDFGHTVHGSGPSQSADDVAKCIVACIRSPRAEVYPYRTSKLLGIVAVIAPAFADRLVQKYSRQISQGADTK